MQTALSTHWPRTSAITPTTQEISVAIAGHSEALRATLDALARRAGLRVVTNRAKHDVLLLLIDSSTPIEEGLAQHKVCAIWTEGTPSRSAVTRLLSAGFSGILSIHATAPSFTLRCRRLAVDCKSSIRHGCAQNRRNQRLLWSQPSQKSSPLASSRC